MTPTERNELFNLNAQIEQLTTRKNILTKKHATERKEAEEYIKSLEWTKNCDVEISRKSGYYNYMLGVYLKLSLDFDDPINNKLNSSFSVICGDSIVLDGESCVSGVYLCYKEIHSINKNLLFQFIEKTKFKSINCDRFESELNQQMNQIISMQNSLEFHGWMKSSQSIFKE